ncbi:Ni/Fe hydrogenase subunit alpha [Candidatus Woesearchaeota archaeon]|nr:MAG: Ni/Fe hydrogenase subunit alpha [Candidatus Woesearchaeota archaeon]
MTRTITLDHITKIEGHAHLTVKIAKGKVKKCELGSTEGARFFEGLVVGRPYDDGVEMTMRICGICSVGHFTASLKALEDAMGVTPSRQTQAMREIMAIGERIRSHATHLYFLSLPDFLGYESALAMAQKYKRQIEDALTLMRTGNEIVTVFGGRQMHPMGGRVGGFTHFPNAQQVKHLLALLEEAKAPALRTLDLFLSLTYPSLTSQREHISLHQQHDDWPLLTGTITSDAGKTFAPERYEEYFTEYVDRWSTAKFVVRRGKSYQLGALPRINNNVHGLAPDLLAKCKRAGITFPSKNPFHNIVAQALELVHWVRRCQKLLAAHKQGFRREAIRVTPRAGTGVGVVEVPRGILFHTYTIDEQGYITRANIMTPTCQNLKAMQEDCKQYLQQLLDAGAGKKTIVLELEKLIRAYDPCFSCSTHFLDVDWEETP